jgi:lipopolysaccharide export LptBFGC system permease protein LptF
MILQRYILREIVATFLMVFLTISMIIFIGIGIQQYRRLEGLGFLFLLKSIPFMFCFAMRYSLPASTLMASVLVFGRLAAENEITAIRASGIPLWRVVNPALALGLCLTALFLLFNDHVAPRAINQQRSLAQQGLLGTLRNPPPVGTTLFFSNCRLLYKRFRNGIFEELAISRVDPKGSVETVWAREAQFVVTDDGPPRFMLQHVIWLVATEKTPPHNWPVGEALLFEYPLDIEPLMQRSRKYYEMPTADLKVLERVWGETGDAGRRAAVAAERHQRIAWAFGPFVLTLLGAPVGILLRKGSRLAGFGASLPGGFVYFLLATVGQVFAPRLHLDPVAVVWFSDGLFLLLGMVLLWRVYRI